MDDGGRAEGGGGGGTSRRGRGRGHRESSVGRGAAAGRLCGDDATTRSVLVFRLGRAGEGAEARQEEIDHPRIAPGGGDGDVRRFLFYFLSPRSPSPETRSSPQTEWRGHPNHPLHLLFCHFFHFLFLPLFHFRERSRFLTNLIFSRPPLPPPPLLS